MSTISAPGAVFCLPTDSGTKSFPHCLPTDPTAAANKKRKVDKDSSSAATGFGGSSPASKYPPNPDSTRCSYYHPSKSRYCKGRPLPSTLLCGNHTPNGGIPCPACGTTVKEGKWKRHENRCNALKLRRQREAEPWYSEGLNLPKGEGEEPGAPRAAEEVRRGRRGANRVTFWGVVARTGCLLRLATPRSVSYASNASLLRFAPSLTLVSAPWPRQGCYAHTFHSVSAPQRPVRA